jgi:hypothetical protein
LKKEIEEVTRRWKDIPCSLISRINSVKMSLISKATYRFSAKSNVTLHRNRKINPKIYLKAQNIPNSQYNSELQEQ